MSCASAIEVDDDDEYSSDNSNNNKDVFVEHKSMCNIYNNSISKHVDEDEDNAFDVVEVDEIEETEHNFEAKTEEQQVFHVSRTEMEEEQHCFLMAETHDKLTVSVEEKDADDAMDEDDADEQQDDNNNDEADEDTEEADDDDDDDLDKLEESLETCAAYGGDTNERSQNVTSDDGMNVSTPNVHNFHDIVHIDVDDVIVEEEEEEEHNEVHIDYFDDDENVDDDQIVNIGINSLITAEENVDDNDEHEMIINENEREYVSFHIGNNATFRYGAGKKKIPGNVAIDDEVDDEDDKRAYTNVMTTPKKTFNIDHSAASKEDEETAADVIGINIEDNVKTNNRSGKGVVVNDDVEADSDADDADNHLLHYHTAATTETLNLLLPEMQASSALDCTSFVDFDEFNTMCLNNIFSDDDEDADNNDIMNRVMQAKVKEPTNTTPTTEMSTANVATFDLTFQNDNNSNSHLSSNSNISDVCTASPSPTASTISPISSPLPVLTATARAANLARARALETKQQQQAAAASARTVIEAHMLPFSNKHQQYQLHLRHQQQQQQRIQQSLQQQQRIQQSLQQQQQQQHRGSSSNITTATNSSNNVVASDHPSTSRNNSQSAVNIFQ